MGCFFICVFREHPWLNEFILSAAIFLELVRHQDHLLLFIIKENQAGLGPGDFFAGFCICDPVKKVAPQFVKVARCDFDS